MSIKASNDVAYSRENEVVSQFKDIIQNDGLAREDYLNALRNVFNHYQRLLDDTKLLTSMGDRLQRKLKSANLLLKQQSEEIQEINDDLQKKNVELKLAIDEITRAKVSRKARTYAIAMAFSLFLFSELLEQVFDSFLDNFWISFSSKVLLFALLKPIESFFEDFFLKQSMDKDKRYLLNKILEEE